MEWQILLHNVNGRAKQTGIAHVTRGEGGWQRTGEMEGMRGKINTLSWTIATHVSQSTRPLRHKFRGFNKDSWLPLAECTAAVYGSGSSERRARADVVSYNERFTP